MGEERKGSWELAHVQVELVDVRKNPGFKSPAPFYYVPTSILDERKALEGNVSKEDVEQILRAGV